MDWTLITTTAVTTLLGGGGTLATIQQIRKSRAEKVSGDEVEANKLVDAKEDKNWARQEQQLVNLEAKLNAMDERLTALEGENDELRATIKSRDMTLASTEMWGAHFIFNVRRASQGDLIPMPIPVAISAYFPSAPTPPPLPPQTP